MKNNKASGMDNLTSDVMVLGGEESVKQITTKMLLDFREREREKKRPVEWKEAKMIILHKKGHTKDIETYRHISGSKPEGSVLAPLLYTVYTQPPSTDICQSGHSYHFFTDDSQLHNSNVFSDFPALVHSLKYCIEDVVQWMSYSMS